MVINWKKFKGTIKRPKCKATIEMMDLPAPFWQATFQYIDPLKTEMSVHGFEEGKLEQAYEWCVKEIKSYERRLKGGDSTD